MRLIPAALTKGGLKKETVAYTDGQYNRAVFPTFTSSKINPAPSYLRSKRFDVLLAKNLYHKP